MRILKVNNTSYVIVKTVVVLFLSVFIFNACKSKKEVISTSASAKSNVELLAYLLKDTLVYNTFSSKINVSLNLGRKSFSAGGSLKMVKDEVFQLSIQFLSMELFRLEFSKDSVKFMDRYNKVYALESIENIKSDADFAFNFYNLQSLITNQLFITGKQAILPEDYPLFSVEQSRNKAFITLQDKQDLQYMFITNYADEIQSLFVTDKNKKNTVLCSYDDFKPIAQDHDFPTVMKLQLKTAGKKETKLDIYFSKIELNKELNMEFNIPSKYRQIRFSGVLELINGMQ